MEGEISIDLFTVFFLSSLRQIIKENPEECKKECMELGRVMGERLNEDFYAKLILLRKINNENIEKYIITFFKHYFAISIILKDGILVIDETFSKLGGECGCYFFCGVLSCVFKPLNGNVVFSVFEENITYQILQNPSK